MVNKQRSNIAGVNPTYTVSFFGTPSPFRRFDLILRYSSRYMDIAFILTLKLLAAQNSSQPAAHSKYKGHVYCLYIGK